jgi:hypothetical protein
MASARRVERRLAHQAVHAGLGAQGAVGVVALDLDRGGLDAGDIAFGFFQQLSLEALAFGVFQVLPQQHRCPVAGLGTTGAGLDVDEAVARVRRIVEHAAEFKLRDISLDALDIRLYRGERVVVVFLARHFEKFGRVLQGRRHAVEHQYHVFQGLAFASQLLRTGGVIPEVRCLGEAYDFF